jgi:hypothetical protein
VVKENMIMDETSSAILMTQAGSVTSGSAALWSIALVTDAQALSAGLGSVADVTRQVRWQLQQEAGSVVLESSLPEIRCLAMLLAASRLTWEDGEAPSRFADDADWLAARIHALALSHVEVDLARIPLLDLANRRLAEWSASRGQSIQRALPVLLTGSAPWSAPMVLRGWSKLPLDGVQHQPGGSGSTTARLLRQRSCDRLLPVLRSMYPAGVKK